MYGKWRKEVLDRDIEMTNKENDMLKKEIKKLKKKNASLIRNIKRIQYENASSEVWHQMLKERSVCKRSGYCEFFADRTWIEFEEVSVRCKIILIGNERDKRNFLERYKNRETILLNPENLSWREIETFCDQSCWGGQMRSFIL